MVFRWLLYKRNLRTSFESLKPIVSFDIIHDPPHQCALAAISMWRPNLASDGGPSKVTEPVLISPKPAHDQSSSRPDEQPEQQLRKNTADDSDNWCSFERELYPQRTTPVELKIDDKPRETVTNWLAAIHKVVAWLADEERLSASNCPIGTEAYTFIGTEEVNPNGTPFKRPQILSNDLILQRGYVNTIAQWQKLRQLLGDLKVDRNKIRVSYKPTEKPAAK